MAIETDQRGAVAILRWDDGENRMNLASMAEWHAALDQLGGVEGPLALVVIGTGKFFSNGLDLDRFGVEPDEMAPTVRSVHQLLGRMLLFPAYTVAAINGHAFAAGAMLSACFDARVMRSDRGYWCLPEVDLGLPFSDGMAAAVTARLPADAAHDAMITGPPLHRRGGAGARDRHRHERRGPPARSRHRPGRADRGQGPEGDRRAQAAAVRRRGPPLRLRALTPTRGREAWRCPGRPPCSWAAHE